MKTRMIAVLLTLCLLFTLCACGAEPGTASAGEPENSGTSSIGNGEGSEPGEEEPVTDAVASVAESILYDPDITPMDLEGVAYLSGSWYEMGTQYAVQCDYGIRRTYAQMGTQMLNNLDGDEEALIQIIDGYLAEIEAECPDLYDFVMGVNDTIEDMTL